MNVGEGLGALATPPHKVQVHCQYVRVSGRRPCGASRRGLSAGCLQLACATHAEWQCLSWRTLLPVTQRSASAVIYPPEGTWQHCSQPALGRQRPATPCQPSSDRTRCLSTRQRPPGCTSPARAATSPSNYYRSCISCFCVKYVGEIVL